MKKLSNTFIIILIFISCKEDNIVSYNNFKKTPKNISNRIRNWEKTNLKLSKSYSNDLNLDYFDYSNSSLYNKNDYQKVIIVNPKKINDSINYTMTFNFQENKIYKALMVKSSKLHDKLLVEYFNFDGVLLFTHVVNFNNKSISFENQENIKTRSDDDRYPCGNSWGQNTAACLADVYSNHGWLSVWATVQTAFIPETAAALATACAIDAATSNDLNCDEGYKPINEEELVTPKL